MKSFTFVRNMLIIVTLSHYLVSSTFASTTNPPLDSNTDNSPNVAFNDSSIVSPHPPSVTFNDSSIVFHGFDTRYQDLPHTYILDHRLNWNATGIEVYDTNGKAVYLVTRVVNGKPLEGRFFAILNVQRTELLRVYQTKPACTFPLRQTWKTSRQVSYKWDTRGGLPDRWHIFSDTKTLTHPEYIYHRHRYGNRGNIDIGESHNRVAKISRNNAESGWEKTKIKSGKVVSVRSNGEIPVEFLLGLVYSTLISYEACAI